MCKVLATARLAKELERRIAGVRDQIWLEWMTMTGIDTFVDVIGPLQLEREHYYKLLIRLTDGEDPMLLTLEIHPDREIRVN